MVAKRYCVIGAGAAGICAAKYVLQEPVGTAEVVVYEQTTQVGGTWVYTDKVGTDQNGLPIHSSMYEGLWTNLPKEVMGFADFEMPAQRRSYIPSSEVLEFLKSYANHFNVVDHVQFEHLVEEVKPIEKSGRWNVTVKDIRNNTTKSESFDYVIVSNGHYFEPLTPGYEGLEIFEGTQLHSHNYRSPSIFQDRKVLIIGAGPSGKDLIFAAAKYAKNVYFSHHVHEKLKHTKLPDKVVQVADVQRLHKHTVEFTDGSCYEVDFILYCTGYYFSFPFLSPDCGIQVEDSWVKPLFKHIININNPTMAFIGIPYHVCTSPMFDLQVRFTLQFYSDRKQLPTQKEMIQDYEAEMEARWSRGLAKRKAHQMGGEVQAAYYADLAKTAGIEPMPVVIPRMHIASNKRKNEDLATYRNDVFRVLDDERFEISYDAELGFGH
ncbi:senecionine N-oxygenase-like [Uranotaenia lowii]|uniref:senecionine N-oxygenase-like n=1 Tax=Uranotaenia lowii TaxID=190385 RepID=UPI00247AE5CE|nr:senecionine N-oxygenase-like [Uranotaenia lowii]